MTDRLDPSSANRNVSRSKSFAGARLHFDYTGNARGRKHKEVRESTHHEARDLYHRNQPSRSPVAQRHPPIPIMERVPTLPASNSSSPSPKRFSRFENYNVYMDSQPAPAPIVHHIPAKIEPPPTTIPISGRHFYKEIDSKPPPSSHNVSHDNGAAFRPQQHIVETFATKNPSTSYAAKYEAKPPIGPFVPTSVPREPTRSQQNLSSYTPSFLLQPVITQPTQVPLSHYRQPDNNQAAQQPRMQHRHHDTNRSMTVTIGYSDLQNKLREEEQKNIREKVLKLEMETRQRIEAEKKAKEDAEKRMRESSSCQDVEEDLIEKFVKDLQTRVHEARSSKNLDGALVGRQINAQTDVEKVIPANKTRSEFTPPNTVEEFSLENYLPRRNGATTKNDEHKDYYYDLDDDQTYSLDDTVSLNSLLSTVTEESNEDYYEADPPMCHIDKKNLDRKNSNCNMEPRVVNYIHNLVDEIFSSLEKNTTLTQELAKLCITTNSDYYDDEDTNMYYGISADAKKFFTPRNSDDE